MWDQEEEEEDEGVEYVALRGYKAQGPDEVSFEAGDTILVFEEGDEWCIGSLYGQEGKFPSAYLGTKM